MKRPLCMVCLVWIGMLAVCMQFKPLPVPDYSGLDRQWMNIQGQVYRKEYKERDGSRIPVLYLKSVHILNESDKKSNECRSSRSEQFPEEELKNIICYIKIEKDTELELPSIGEQVQISGQVRCFYPATNPGEFDQREYYQLSEIAFALEKVQLEKISGKEKPLQEGMYRLRLYFGCRMDSVLPEKEAGIMKAMLLGDKNGLDESTKELYQKSSIIHILSISGLHISMIGMGIYRLLRGLKRSVTSSALLSIGLIYCYGLMSGMSMSAVRAIFMFCLHLLADMVGRTYDMLTALALAAVLLLLEQPRYIYHSGFLFSFGAVAALGVLLPVLYERGREGLPLRGIKRKRQQLGEALMSGCCVTLATLPVHFMFYYQFPVYSVLLNLAIIPSMTILMAAGMITMLTAGWLPWLAKTAAYGICMILKLYEALCLLMDRLPGGMLVSGQPEKWQAAVYMLLLAALIWQEKQVQKGMKKGKLERRGTNSSRVSAWRMRKLPGFWKGQWVLAALCILCIRTESGLQITLLDVGQGDCIYIRTESGNHYLIDGGSATKRETMNYQVMPYLKSEGVSCLDAVFITHSDLDHCSALLEWMEQKRMKDVAIGTLILPAIDEESKDEQYRKLEQLARENDIPLQYMSRGQKITDGKLVLHCIHPSKDYKTPNPNEYSLNLLLTYGKFKALFTGDVEGRGEEEMWEYLGNADFQLMLLKVAHHGSKYSTSEELLSVLQPRISLISCGRENSYGHPHEELLNRLEKSGTRIYSTAECGAVTIRVKKERVQIKQYLKEEGG